MVRPESSPEEWRNTIGLEAYLQVSTAGRVRSITKPDALGRVVTGKLLTPRMSGRYMRVRIRSNHRIVERSVHVLVLEAFVGPRPGGMQACHNDGDRRNNSLSNLRWDTCKANKADAIRHRTAVFAENFHGASGHRAADGKPSEKMQRYLHRPKMTPDERRQAGRSNTRRYRAKLASKGAHS